MTNQLCSSKYLRDNVTILQVCVTAISLTYFNFDFERSCLVCQFRMADSFTSDPMSPCNLCHGEEVSQRHELVANSKLC